MNALKTAVLLGLLSGVLIVGGGSLFGERGLVYGLGLAVALNFFSYFFSEKMALSASGAVPVTESQNSQVWDRVAPIARRLTEKMGLPMPRLWVIPEEAPNAFATGRNPAHSSVAVTVGLLELLDDEELEGVIAHELGHVRNRDILIASVAATIAAAITYLAQFAMFFGGRRSDDDDGPNPVAALLMLILAPLAAAMIQMAISRTREYSADAAAAKYAGTPNGLMRALEKLELWSKRIPLDTPAAMSHMYIIKPLSGESMARLFSTHPSTADRIARLRSLRLA